ncbi:MAG: very short patch repair endonuclease [Frankiales bacterium]|nr:very short patch repair endonuclease [Frankiales bacterium]
MTSEAVSRRMARTGRRDTAPELALRSELHRRGLRFRVDFPPIRGVRRRADVVFTRKRVAVFVDGCFWHSCPLHGTWPKKNRAWWREKIEANVRRDRDTNERLMEAGWSVVRVWEHETSQNAADRVVKALG